MDAATADGYGQSRYRKLWIMILNATPDGSHQTALKEAMYAKFCTLKWAPSPDNRKWYGHLGISVIQNPVPLSMVDAGYAGLDVVLATEAARVRR